MNLKDTINNNDTNFIKDITEIINNIKKELGIDKNNQIMDCNDIQILYCGKTSFMSPETLEAQESTNMQVSTNTKDNPLYVKITDSPMPEEKKDFISNLNIKVYGNDISIVDKARLISDTFDIIVDNRNNDCVELKSLKNDAYLTRRLNEEQNEISESAINMINEHGNYIEASLDSIISQGNKKFDSDTNRIIKKYRFDSIQTNKIIDKIGNVSKDVNDAENNICHYLSIIADSKDYKEMIPILSVTVGGFFGWSINGENSTISCRPSVDVMATLFVSTLLKKVKDTIATDKFVKDSVALQKYTDSIRELALRVHDNWGLYAHYLGAKFNSKSTHADLSTQNNIWDGYFLSFGFMYGWYILKTFNILPDKVFSRTFRINGYLGYYTSNSKDYTNPDITLAQWKGLEGRIELNLGEFNYKFPLELCVAYNMMINLDNSVNKRVSFDFNDGKEEILMRNCFFHGFSFGLRYTF